MQEHFGLMKSYLFIFSLFHLTHGNISEKILLQEMSEILLPMFSPKSFMVLSVTFKSLINFEFILLYGIRRYSRFIFLYVSVQFFQQHLFNRLFYPIVCSFLIVKYLLTI